MGDIYSDMPTLVDSRGFDNSPPRTNGHSTPHGYGFASFDPYYQPGAAPPPPPPSFGPSPAWVTPVPFGGWDSQSSTPMSWGSLTPPMVAPMVPAAVPVVPPATIMSGHSMLSVSREGWPRPLAGREPSDSGPPWRDADDHERMLSPPRAKTPLSRSVSLSSSPSSGSLQSGSLSRKTSLVRGKFAEAQKRPPREWRADFGVSGIGLLSGLLGTRGRSKSFGGGGEELKVKLHPYIQYNILKPPMSLDLRDSPNLLKFRALKDGQLTSWDFMRFVCEPPLLHMRLYHAQLPWYIDVEAENPRGVTLYDMFCAIHYCMMTPIQGADYYNVEMTGEMRTQVGDAWTERCHSQQERDQGIKRVDYLMGRVVMEGIQKGKDGLWEIKTRRPGPS